MLLHLLRFLGKYSSNDLAFLEESLNVGKEVVCQPIFLLDWFLTLVTGVHYVGFVIFDLQKKIKNVYPPASEASREFINIRHKKISPTSILSTLWCL